MAITGFLGSEGENQFCYMTLTYSILHVIGEEICGHILKGCRNGHLEEHVDGCGYRLKAWMTRVEGIKKAK